MRLSGGNESSASSGKTAAAAISPSKFWVSPVVDAFWPMKKMQLSLAAPQSSTSPSRVCVPTAWPSTTSVMVPSSARISTCTKNGQNVSQQFAQPGVIHRHRKETETETDTETDTHTDT